MSDWIEKNNDHILEGHGNKFVVCHVLYSKQLPPKWEIKQSPFLLDVNKRFATLDKAKAYCENRYKELNGQREEIIRLREENEKLREALRPIVPSKVLDEEESTLVSNRLLNDALDVYLARSRHDDDETPRAAIEGVTEPESPKAETEFFVFDEFAPLPEPAPPWRDIESAPKNGTDFLALIPYNQKHHQMVGCFAPEGKFRSWPSRHEYRPTHWMPLPEPPK